MYVWIVLATFLAILASFNLPVRPDMHQLESQPLAEAELNKMYLKHKYATKYMKKKITRTGATVTKGYGDHLGNDIIAESDMAGFYELPEIFVWDNGYESYFFCFNDINSQSVDCTSSEEDYVLTIGELPDKWVNPQTNFINGEFERVLGKAFAGKKNCGLIVEDDECPKASGSDTGYKLYRYYIKGEDETLEDFCFPAGMDADNILYDYDLNRAIVCVDRIYKSS